MKKPIISILTEAFSVSEEFLKNVLDSIFAQTTSDFEVYVIDKKEDQNKVRFIESYTAYHKKLQYMPIYDKDCVSQIIEVLKQLNGKYIAFLPAFHMYASKDWLRQCIDFLEANDKISLIHSAYHSIDSDGNIQTRSYPQEEIPSEERYLSYWLATANCFAPSTFCVCAKVFKSIMEEVSPKEDPAFMFNYYFNKNGFLSKYVPCISTYKLNRLGEAKDNSQKALLEIEEYYVDKVNKYRRSLLSRKEGHTYKKANGDVVGTVRRDKLDVLGKWIHYHELLHSNDQRIGKTYRTSMVGTLNEKTRDDWVVKKIEDLPSGLKILDAGAGEMRYKRYCGHLHYVSHDFCQYNAEDNGKGIHPTKWDVAKIDIVSDITMIPEEDESYDVILCTEVLEHIPNPIKALFEFARLLKVRGILILTAPFCSFTHFSPYHYFSGFSSEFYKYHLPKYGFDIKEIVPNGNYFEFVAQELRRLKSVAMKYCNFENNKIVDDFVKPLLSLTQHLSGNDINSNEFLCFGHHVFAIKNSKCVADEFAN